MPSLFEFLGSIVKSWDPSPQRARPIQLIFMARACTARADCPPATFHWTEYYRLFGGRLLVRTNEDGRLTDPS